MKEIKSARREHAGRYLQRDRRERERERLEDIEIRILSSGKTERKKARIIETQNKAGGYSIEHSTAAFLSSLYPQNKYTHIITTVYTYVSDCEHVHV